MNKQPNIIFIIADQMRGDCLSSDGHSIVETPYLDQLAACGARFENAYTACPSCLPARATMMTGMNQWHTGILGMGIGQKRIPSDFPYTLAGELTKNGYNTKLVGKGHFNPNNSKMGFQNIELDESNRHILQGEKDAYREWFDEQTKGKDLSPDDHGVNWNSWISRPWHTEEYLHPTAWTMTRSLDYLEKREKNKPYFLNISFARPHSPYVPPKHYFDMYINQDLPEPYLGDWSKMHDDIKTATNVNAWRGKRTSKQIKRARAGYYGEISFIDTQIGRLVNWLERCDQKDVNNTVIIFTADHGDMMGDHNLWRKTYAYEGSVRVPFIVKPAGAFVAQYRDSVDEPVELKDIMPTILDFAGIDIPSTVDGKSIKHLIAEKDNTWRKYIHGEHSTCYSSEQEMQYITNGKRKYIWLPRLGIEQYFDLENDPGEIENLIDMPSMEKEIEVFRNYLVQEFTERDCGWVKDGKLVCPSDEPLVSPWRDKRKTQ